MNGRSFRGAARPPLPVVGRVVAWLGAVLSGLSLIGTITGAWVLDQDLRSASGLGALYHDRPGLGLYAWVRILVLAVLNGSLVAGCVGILAQKAWSRHVALIAAAALAVFAALDPLVMVPAQASILPWPTDDLWHHPLVRGALFAFSVQLFVFVCLWIVLRDADVRRALQ